VLAVSPARKKIYRLAARRIVEMALAGKPLPREIVTEQSLDNAFALDMAMGGSTNTVLHALAIAHEAGIKYDLNRINNISNKCPNICKVAPSSQFHVEDVDRAGGVSAILRRIAEIPGLINKDCPTVTGKNIWQNVARSRVKDETVIRPLNNPYSSDGGLTILKGNLAEGGAVEPARRIDAGNRQILGEGVRLVLVKGADRPLHG